MSSLLRRPLAPRRAHLLDPLVQIHAACRRRAWGGPDRWSLSSSGRAVDEVAGRRFLKES